VVAIERLTTDPWGAATADLHTMLLMIASMAFALLAFGTAMHTRDLYPGYSAVTRRQTKARAVLEGWRELYLAQCEALFRQSPQTVEAKVAQVEASRAAIRGHREAIGQLGDRYGAAVGAIESSCRASIERYRTTNRQVRTAPAPADFGLPWAGFAPTDRADRANRGDATGLARVPRTTDRPEDLAVAAQRLRAELERRFGKVLEEASDFFAAADAEAEGLPGPQAVALISFQSASTLEPIPARLTAMT
jgi:hypothetical protein